MLATAAIKPVLLDETQATNDQDYALVQVYRTAAGEKLRVTVVRAFYTRQSYAKVEVLTPARTWTELATEPPSNWYAGTPLTPTSQTIREILGDLASNLVNRAVTILS